MKQLRVGTVASIVLCAVSQARAGDSERNYLIVLVDDVGVDKISAYEVDHPNEVGRFAPQTKTVDSLADAGIRFSRAWANPACSPTRASLQTGVHPFRHGVGVGVELLDLGVDPDDFDMLGEGFSRAGYATAFFGKWHIGSEDIAGNVGYPTSVPYFDQPHPARSGYTHFDGSYGGISTIGEYTDWTRTAWSDSRGSGSAFTERDHTTSVVTDAAATWIAARTEAWLAVLAYHAPHANTLPNGRPAWRYGDADSDCYRTPELACLASKSCADETRAVYQALLECVDIHVGELLDGMDPAVLDRTTILFLGDNGTPHEVGEGVFSHHGKSSVYETGLRVPLILADGKTWRTGKQGVITAPGRTSSATIQVTDLHATLYEAALGEITNSADSRSFATCLTDTDVACGFGSPLGYGELFDVADDGAIVIGKSGVRQGDAKAMFEYDAAGACLAQRTFDLSADPWEQNPLSNTRGIAVALRDAMTALHAGTGSWADGVPVCQ